MGSGTFGTKKAVALKLDGYRSLSGSIEKDEVRILPLIAGLWLIIPWLWATGYPDEYIFELERIPQRGPQVSIGQRSRMLALYEACVEKQLADSSVDCAGYRAAIEVLAREGSKLKGFPAGPK